jgi:hypothetical protein
MGAFYINSVESKSEQNKSTFLNFVMIKQILLWKYINLYLFFSSIECLLKMYYTGNNNDIRTIIYFVETNINLFKIYNELE